MLLLEIAINLQNINIYNTLITFSLRRSQSLKHALWNRMNLAWGFLTKLPSLILWFVIWILIRVPLKVIKSIFHNAPMAMNMAEGISRLFVSLASKFSLSEWIADLCFSFQLAVTLG